MRLCIAVAVFAIIAWADSEQVAKLRKNSLIQRLSVDYQPALAGVIGDIIGFDTRGICGGSLVSGNRVVTAAHCWNDGIHQVRRFTVVLGSTLVFSGGTRVGSSVVAMHPNWNPLLARNDIAVIYLTSVLPLSDIINSVARPTGTQIFEDFVGEGAIAVGFGIIGDNAGINPEQSLNHMRLNVITNSICTIAFPIIIQSSHICTSGLGGVNTCSGESGGPLLPTRDGRPILIDVSSFASTLGCPTCQLLLLVSRLTWTS